jgi:molybdopterin-guanine dinucleotide biosynthesis protein A
MIDDISGVVLAGGANKRFNGLVKANIVIGGKTIMSRIMDTIGELFSDIVIVTNTPGSFAGLENYKVVGDQFRNIGPLGGIHAALKASEKSACFIFAGDMPFLDSGIISRQAEYFRKNLCDVLIPRTGNYIEPLHAIYNNRILRSLEDYLVSKQSYAVRKFLKTVDLAYFDLSLSDMTGKPFTNINYPGDIKGEGNI